RQVREPARASPWTQVDRALRIVATIRGAGSQKPLLVATIRGAGAEKPLLVATIRGVGAQKPLLVATIEGFRAGFWLRLSACGPTTRLPTERHSFRRRTVSGRTSAMRSKSPST